MGGCVTVRIERVWVLAMVWGVVGAAGCLHGSPEALPEVCNGIDDDLDGRADEGRHYILDGVPRGTLVCGEFPKNPGSGDWVCKDVTCVVRCIAGKVDINRDPADGCEAECIPSEAGIDVCLPGLPACRDNCDNYDDDCDGRIDEDRGYPLSRLPGVCADDPMVCDGGWMEADHGRLSARYEAEEARCDGLDNDCDGKTDEALADSPDSDCDGLDDDCDGRVDEDRACAETVCAADTLVPPCNGCPEGTVIPGRDPVSGAWVCAPAGEFTMGSPDGGPQVPVAINRPLMVQTHEATQAQWRAVFGNSPSALGGCGDDCPVETVNWFEAAAYVNRLSNDAGLESCYALVDCAREPGDDMECDPEVARATIDCDGYRLPTEAEWEYLARGGTQTRFWSGDTEEDLARVGWYGDNSSGQPHPVCTLPVAPPHHPWGLCDVHGNVWEWTESWYGLYPDPPADGAPLADPLGPPRGDWRVVRGGSFLGGARGVRAAGRVWWPPAVRFGYLGFRPVRFAGPPPRAR